MLGSTLEIRIPGRCSATEERELVDHFRAKFERRRDAEAIDLDRRAEALADQFDTHLIVVARGRSSWSASASARRPRSIASASRRRSNLARK